MPSRRVDYLLIGGGLASANCARWLRESGSDGTILLVGREPDAPYNRPNCSKGYLRGVETRADPLFRPDGWWDEQEVELLTKTSVTALDVQALTATLSTREEIQFGRALIATGANVRRLNVPGAELEQLHYLRTLGNADAIREGVADAEDVVLIGGSFIACEVAASLTAMGKRCTLVMQESVTLEARIGERAGSFIQDLLESHGVTVCGDDGLERFEGDGRVARVVTTRGRELPAQAVVIGAGVAPDVTLARRAGLQIGDRGGVRCDSRLESSVPGIYAAGDICEYESVLHDGRRVRLEHWDVAFNQGRAVAANMLGADEPYSTVPYFFSVLAEWGEVESVGPVSEWDEEVVRGSYDDGSFTTWFIKDGKLNAALTWGRSDDLDHARRMIENPEPLSDAQRAVLRDVDADLGRIGA